MGTVCSQEGETFLIGKLDLCAKPPDSNISQKIYWGKVDRKYEKQNWTILLTVSTTSFSVAGLTATFTVGMSKFDHRVVTLLKSSDPE